MNAPWPPPTKAIDFAHETKTPQVVKVPDQPLYEIAIPLAVRGEVVGLVDMLVSRERSNSAIRREMERCASLIPPSLRTTASAASR